MTPLTEIVCLTQVQHKRIVENLLYSHTGGVELLGFAMSISINGFLKNRLSGQNEGSWSFTAQPNLRESFIFYYQAHVMFKRTNRNTDWRS